MDIIITTAISVATGLIGLWYGTRVQQQDLQSKSLDNILKQIEVYETIIENLRSEVHSLITKVEEQQKIIKDLETSVEELCSKKM